MPKAVQRDAPAAVKRANEATLGVKGAKMFIVQPVPSLDQDHQWCFSGELQSRTGSIPRVCP